MSNAVRRFTRAIFIGARAAGKQIFLLGLCAAMAEAQGQTPAPPPVPAPTPPAATTPAPAVTPAQVLAKPTGKRVLLVVWDGMRPDFIRPDTSPNAWALVQRGTFFTNNHATYVSTTEVNGSTISTGMKPQHHGIFANAEYRPEVNLTTPIGTEGAWGIRVWDALTGNRWLLAPTIAEQARRAGLTAMVAGAKSVAILHDRTFDRTGLPPGLYGGLTYPRAYLGVLEKALGKWPELSKQNDAWADLTWPPLPPEEGEPPAPEKKRKIKLPEGYVPTSNKPQNLWTARALVEQMWKDGVPNFTTLWLGDPDQSQHLTQPGSPTALQAIHDSDTHLGLAIAELEKRKLLDETNIFLVSDHAFSTMERNVPFGRMMKSFGRTAKKPFSAVKRFRQTPRPGEVLYFPAGASTLIYVVDHDSAIIAEIAEWLQTGDFAGPIFTRDGLPGTFKFSDAWIDTPSAPDLMFSASWSDRPNKYGAKGTLALETLHPGAGMHGSLSPFDIHNTLLGAGPDIRKGFRDELPTGNVDVAPTILHLLGVKPEKTLDGRVLAEALVGTTGEAPKPVTTKKEITRALPDGKSWTQWLQFTAFGDKTYLDQGNSSAAK